MAEAISLDVAGSCAPVLAAGYHERWEGEEGVSVPYSGHGLCHGPASPSTSPGEPCTFVDWLANT